MPTAQEILDTQYDLLYKIMPSYVYDRDWEKAKLYFQARLQVIRTEVDEYEKKVDDVEQRTAALMARVVELENA